MLQNIAIVDILNKFLFSKNRGEKRAIQIEAADSVCLNSQCTIICRGPAKEMTLAVDNNDERKLPGNCEEGFSKCRTEN